MSPGTIARLKSVGHVNRTLVFLRSDSGLFPPRSQAHARGARNGVVTSTVIRPVLKRESPRLCEPAGRRGGRFAASDGLNLTWPVPKDGQGGCFSLAMGVGILIQVRFQVLVEHLERKRLGEAGQFSEETKPWCVAHQIAAHEEKTAAVGRIHRHGFS